MSHLSSPRLVLLCVYAYMCACALCVSSALEGQKRHQICGNWRYGWLSATMLGNELGSSARVVSALNHWAIAPTLDIVPCSKRLLVCSLLPKPEKNPDWWIRFLFEKGKTGCREIGNRTMSMIWPGLRDTEDLEQVDVMGYGVEMDRMVKSWIAEMWNESWIG